MKRYFFWGIFVSVLLVLLYIPPDSYAQEASAPTGNFVSVKGQKVVAANGKELFLKGIGLGNWLLPEGYMWKFDKAVSPRQIHEVISELVGPAAARDFWQEYRDRYITQEDLAYLKKIGINSVRVAIDYRILTPEQHPDIWLESGFKQLDKLVEWCDQEGLYLILDMHAAPGGQTGENIDNGWGYPFLFKSPESQRRVIEVWKKLANRYKDEPAILGYDLLNEPIPTFEGYEELNKYLEPLYKRITKAIREVDSNHIIILEGAQWATNFGVFDKPFDDNMIYSFHKYWMPPEQEQIQEFVNFGDKYNVPIWLGESGENDNKWIDSFRSLLEKNDIGWSFWPYKKLDSESCIVSIPSPEGWTKIRQFAAKWGQNFKSLREGRPGIQKSREILDQYLDNLRFNHCKPNRGYIKALGLAP